MAGNQPGLEFLADCTDAELQFLVDLILDKGVDGEILSNSKVFQDNFPNHRAYLDFIQDEIVDLGNNRFKIFGSRRTYKGVLCDVCEKMNIAYDSSMPLREIESRLLDALGAGLEEESANNRKARIYSISVNAKDKVGGPYYSFTVPAYTYIAYLRRVHDRR